MIVSYPPRYVWFASARKETETGLLVVVDVDGHLLPLAGRDAAVEHDVDLAVRAALHLRQAKVRDDQTEKAGTAPDVAALATDCRIVSDC